MGNVFCFDQMDKMFDLQTNLEETSFLLTRSKV